MLLNSKILGYQWMNPSDIRRQFINQNSWNCYHNLRLNNEKRLIIGIHQFYKAAVFTTFENKLISRHDYGKICAGCELSLLEIFTTKVSWIVISKVLNNSTFDKEFSEVLICELLCTALFHVLQVSSSNLFRLDRVLATENGLMERNKKLKNILSSPVSNRRLQ